MFASAARADVSVLPGTGTQLTSDPAGQSRFEAIAGRIASAIAGKPVTVDCASPDAWSALAAEHGFDPSAESGYVASSWDARTGALVDLSTTAVLEGDAVCAPLERFAAAATKPTRCRGGAARTTLRASSARSAGPVSCYLAGGRAVARMPASYWSAYSQYGWALLTLAHEAVHLGGVVGGRLPDGTPVGDPQAEAKADCVGLQWIPYVAEQLGDAQSDAAAIAGYAWHYLYASLRTAGPPGYWSADCGPGAPLDLHLATGFDWS